jgi:hypothetical protein
VVEVLLSDEQGAWLSEVAADHKPPLTTNEVLCQLVDQAIADGQAAALRRAEQLEIYRASGYAEHHPDYPDFPRDSPHD